MQVEPADLGNNFMLEVDSLGGSRAQHVTELLKELNDSVAGSFVEEDPDHLIKNNPTFFHDFDLIIVTQVLDYMQLHLYLHHAVSAQCFHVHPKTTLKYGTLAAFLAGGLFLYAGGFLQGCACSCERKLSDV